MLRQVPLIKCPAFQPPKPITLNTNYEKLIPTLYKSVVPPKISLSDQDIVNWLDDMNGWKEKLNRSLDKNAEFDTWLQKQQLSIAPGFDSSIMKPMVKKSDKEVNEKNEGVNEKSDKINELDQLFGETKIDDNEP